MSLPPLPRWSSAVWLLYFLSYIFLPISMPLPLCCNSFGPTFQVSFCSVVSNLLLNIATDTFNSFFILHFCNFYLVYFQNNLIITCYELMFLIFYFFTLFIYMILKYSSHNLHLYSNKKSLWGLFLWYTYWLSIMVRVTTLMTVYHDPSF